MDTSYLLIVLSFAWASAQSPAEFENLKAQSDIIIANKTLDNLLGVVKGTRPCSGPGQVLEWRVQGCNSKKSPCRVAWDEEVKYEIDFVSSQDIQNVKSVKILQIFIIKGKPKRYVFVETSNSAVAGIPTTIRGTYEIPMKFKQLRVVIQQVLYSKRYDNKEICVEGDFQVQ